MARPRLAPASRARLVLLTSLLLAAAGCGAAPPRQPAPGLAARCSTRAAAGRLAAAPARSVPLPGRPFAALALPGGRQVVVSLTVPAGIGIRGALAVLAVQGQGARLVRTIALPPSASGGSGMALTHDGRLLLVAAQAATVVLSVPALEHGAAHPVVGVLTDGGAGETEVAVSADDRYAFVTDEASAGLSVFDLALARRRGFAARGVAAGIVPLAPGPVGVAVAPAGDRVYVTTLGGYGDFGRLWAVSARRAESGGGRAAVLADAPAGCQPARVAVSPGGTTVWVTALQSKALLGFAAAVLERHPPPAGGHRPATALRAVVLVGSEPVGLLLLDGGRTAVVGDSNRGLVAGTGDRQVPRISVVSTAAALAGRPAVTGSLPAGLFPRDLGYDPATAEVLVPDYLSDSVELVRAPAA